MLLGEPGVGKTEIFNGAASFWLAHRDDPAIIPPRLKDMRFLSLQMAKLTAGTGARGDFEKRLIGVLDGVKQSPVPIMLFVDEVHTLIGAGNAAGGLDAANILKPALADAGSGLRCAAATTWGEYKRHIQKDAALERRFMVIPTAEPTFEQAAEMIYALIPDYEAAHGCDYGLDDENHRDVLTRAARLAKKMPGRHLPDCLFDLVDEVGVRNRGRRVAFEDYIAAIADMTGVPRHAVAGDDLDFFLNFESRLGERIVGQEEPKKALAAAVLRHQVGLGNPRQPAGSFLFLGPTGVGKTETGEALADLLFGSSGHIKRFNMTEFSEAHTAARLFGAPPGYVGFEQGGEATEFVRRHPRSVIMLDEIEKANPAVLKSLFAVLDNAYLTDGQGETFDFSNAIIVMSSNATYDQLRKSAIGFQSGAPIAAPPDGTRPARQQEEEL